MDAWQLGKECVHLRTADVASSTHQGLKVCVVYVILLILISGCQYISYVRIVLEQNFLWSTLMQLHIQGDFFGWSFSSLHWQVHKLNWV
jgi:hypothetical protein